MAIVGARQPRASARSYATVELSTAADGLSDVVMLGGLTLSSIQMSTAWTAARLAFLGSVDGTTNLGPVKIPSSTLGSSVVAYSAAANDVIVFDPNIWHGVAALQLVSIATGSTNAVAQTTARTITLGLSEVTKRS